MRTRRSSTKRRSNPPRWRHGYRRRIGCTCRMMRSYRSSRRMTASSTESPGTPETRRTTITLCCCSTDPLNIYRKQVIKQADVVLAVFLLGDAFSPEAKKRNFEFYDPLTTGDSSLSSCVEAIIAAQVGDIG